MCRKKREMIDTEGPFRLGVELASLQKEVHEAMTACTKEVRRGIKEGLAAREHNEHVIVTYDQIGRSSN